MGAPSVGQKKITPKRMQHSDHGIKSLNYKTCDLRQFHSYGWDKTGHIAAGTRPVKFT